MDKKKIYIFATDVSAVSFCEMFYYFSKKNGSDLLNDGTNSNDQIIRQKKLDDGKKAHSKLHSRFYDNSTFHSILDNAITKVRTEKTILCTRELTLKIETDQYVLIGRIDELLIEPGKFTIIDDKNILSLSNFDRELYSEQLSVYGAMFNFLYTPFWPIFVKIRKAKNRPDDLDIIFLSEEFFKKNYNLDKSITKIINYWSGEIILQKTRDTKKCELCWYQIPCREK